MNLLLTKFIEIFHLQVLIVESFNINSSNNQLLIRRRSIKANTQINHLMFYNCSHNNNINPRLLVFNNPR